MIATMRIYPFVVILISCLTNPPLAKASLTDDDKCPLNDLSEEFVLTLYDGFFQSDENEREFIDRIHMKHRTQTNNNVCGQENHFALRQLDGIRTNFSQTDQSHKTVTHHCCCNSESIFISPDTAIDDRGQNVTLVQYDNHRQYFESENCQQVEPCSCHCKCKQSPYLVHALIHNPKDGDGRLPMVVRAISIPGFCKCFN